MKLSVIFFVGYFLIVPSSAGIFGIGRTQSVAAKGKLLCNGRPAGNIKIKLFDYDPNSPDDKMAEGTSDADGTFVLAGSESEISTIDPKLSM